MTWSLLGDFSATAFTARPEWFRIGIALATISAAWARESATMAKTQQDVEDDRVADDHYLHLAAMFGAAAFAWQLYGLWVGIAVLVALFVVISTTNALITA